MHLCMQEEKIKNHYQKLSSCCKSAEGKSVELANACHRHDTIRLKHRHEIMRRRLSSSEHISSSNRVLSGWPHFKPGIPQVPVDMGVGPVVPHGSHVPATLADPQGTAAKDLTPFCEETAQASAINSRYSKSPGLNVQGSSVQLQSCAHSKAAQVEPNSLTTNSACSARISARLQACDRTSLAQKPSRLPTPGTFRPATADVPRTVHSDRHAASVGDYMPRPTTVLSSVRARSDCGRHLCRIDNKDLWQLQCCNHVDRIDVLQAATSVTID
jgi:hypothetical protein